MSGARPFRMVARMPDDVPRDMRHLSKQFPGRRTFIPSNPGEGRRCSLYAASERPHPRCDQRRALEATGDLFQERRDYARQRQAVIAANAELRERELIKLASLASAMAGVLRQRGVPDPAASLTAEAGIAVFRVAFERWTQESSRGDLPRYIRESLDELRAVTAGKGAPAASGAGRSAPANAR